MTRNDNQPNQVTFGEIGKGLDQGIETGDALRVAGLQHLQRMRAIKGASLAREETRLTKKYGEQSPLVKETAARRATNDSLQQQVDVALARAQTPSVAPDPKAWILHGCVRDAAGAGQANLTVALYDANGRQIEALKYACTDKNGYFQLKTSQGVPRAPITDAAGASETIARAAGGDSGSSAFIHVTDSSGATLYKDSASVTPTLGEVVYREIFLDGRGGQCAPPGGAKPTMPSGGKDKPASKDKSKR